MKNEEVSDSMKASTCIRFSSDFEGLKPSPPIFALRGNNSRVFAFNIKSHKQFFIKKSPGQTHPGSGDSEEYSWGRSIPAVLTTSLTTFVVTGVFQR